jgi:hypothetical protein
MEINCGGLTAGTIPKLAYKDSENVQVRLVALQDKKQTQDF